MKSIKTVLITTSLLLIANVSFSQINFNGQLIQRSEFRNGYGKLIKTTEDPGFSIGQRFRIEGDYKFEKGRMYISVQDIRTWGNAALAKLNDPNFSVFEAYTELNLDSNWKLKLGRQELNYGNARFLGNLDWALQARSHDFALLKYEKKAMKIHFGGGFNQNVEALNGNIYTQANQYKVAQFARMENRISNLNYSVLFWNNGLQHIKRDSLNLVIEQKVYYSQTIGVSRINLNINGGSIDGFYYHQLGKDIAGREINAFNASASITQHIKIDAEKKSSLKLRAGAEILSGTKAENKAKENNSYSPFFGTNHVHNGFMDYFYVGGRFENSFGLNDFFINARLNVNSTFFVAVDQHLFQSNVRMNVNNVDFGNKIGTETDFTMGKVFNKAISLQFGYSQFWGNTMFQNMESNIGKKPMQNWAYLMLIIRPNSDKKFISLSI